jgi:hypothetical protein
VGGEELPLYLDEQEDYDAQLVEMALDDEQVDGIDGPDNLI